jgi:hypothetical protein
MKTRLTISANLRTPFKDLRKAVSTFMGNEGMLLVVLEQSPVMLRCKRTSSESVVPEEAISFHLQEITVRCNHF